MSGHRFSERLAPEVDSAAAAAEEPLSTTSASTGGHHSVKQPRHVAFLVERELKETEAGETPRAARAGRRSGAATWPTEEQGSWSGRAEADALRQRALQCGEDFLRVASGLGYEVVTHTPTAFLRRGVTEKTSAPAAVAKPEKQAGTGCTTAKGATACPSLGGAPLSPPSAAVTTGGLAGSFLSSSPPIFLQEGELDSGSSRSSSAGTEEQVGTVPVIGPLLQGSEPVQHRLSADAPLRALEVQAQRMTGAHAGINRYPAAITSSLSLPDGMPTLAADGSGGRMSSHRLPLTGLGVEHHTNDGARHPAPTAFNNPRLVQSMPVTGHPSPSSGSPSLHPALPPRTVFASRNHPVTASLMVPGQQSNAFAVRLSILDAASSRAASNANISVSTEHLNGHEFANAGGLQSTNNRFFTPSSDALNTPAVRMMDDDDWPRMAGRLIQ
ncbi:hypothetical protein LSCM1_04391 [Leishmania martiniquensis]|uniref:Uncharacterized protein n=1 Tax=Leishmania martiniquensis TaxID=1580590 RepID=A0A836GEY8_9TRYP|nr:hypothetical protein LSCM1_04391 [Leishmania martiniquensis]